MAGRRTLRAGRAVPWADESRKDDLGLEEREDVRVEVMVAIDEILVSGVCLVSLKEGERREGNGII